MPHTDRRVELRATGSGADRSANGREIDTLITELRSCGLQIDEPRHGLGHSLCGIALSATPAARDPCGQVGGTLSSRTSHALQQGVPVTLDVSGVVGDAHDFEHFCRELCEQGVSPSPLLSLYCEQPAISLRALALIGRCYFGAGKRYVAVHPPSSLRAGDWRYLWRRAGSRWAVLPVYSDTVCAASPLLCDEPARTVLPLAGLRVPRDSAWLPIRLSLERFADAQGRIAEHALERALQAAVDIGERLLDLLRWPPGPLSDDLRRNRRIAVQLDGIGDLACLQRADPGDLSVQEDLHHLLRHIRSHLQAHSAALAAAHGSCPAISMLNPALQTTDVERRRRWSDHWQSAVQRHAVRHRNLLTVSPYAVIPERPAERAAWADLLPLIGVADCCGFAAPRVPKYWNLLDYKAFHCRAAAQIARRGNGCGIATRV